MAVVCSREPGNEEESIIKQIPAHEHGHATRHQYAANDGISDVAKAARAEWPFGNIVVGRIGLPGQFHHWRESAQAAFMDQRAKLENANPTNDEQQAALANAEQTIENSLGHPD
jgi:hypothetical protein